MAGFYLSTGKVIMTHSTCENNLGATDMVFGQRLLPAALKLHPLYALSTCDKSPSGSIRARTSGTPNMSSSFPY